MTEAVDLDQLAAPAILAWRPYPPLNLPETRSQIGGLPLLASPADWPRAVDGTPLHFLARIDCKELPKQRGDLPGEGVLQFFALVDDDYGWNDEGMAWGDEVGTSGGYRVLYALEPGRPTPPPADLPPIRDGRHSWDRDFRLPEEPLTNVYPSWPLAFAAIPTLPFSLDAGERLGGPGTEDIESATGFAPFEHKLPEWCREGEGLRLPPHAPGEPAFPQVWILCDRIARHLACAAIQWREQQAEVAALGRLEQDARHWIARANDAGLDKPVGVADAEAFVAWLDGVANHPVKLVRMALYGLSTGAMQRGLESAIRYCGAHPAAAALVPREIFTELGEDHAIVRTGGIYGQGFVEKHHQMLGFCKASQDIEIFDNEVPLLQLVSDYGVEFMFCDVGEIHFFIDKDDLAARRFERARAHTQGG